MTTTTMTTTSQQTIFDWENDYRGWVGKARAESNYIASFWSRFDDGNGFWFPCEWERYSLEINDGMVEDDDDDANQSEYKQRTKMDERMRETAERKKTKLHFSYVPSMWNVLEFRFNLNRNKMQTCSTFLNSFRIRCLRLCRGSSSSSSVVMWSGAQFRLVSSSWLRIENCASASVLHVSRYHMSECEIAFVAILRIWLSLSSVPAHNIFEYSPKSIIRWQQRHRSRPKRSEKGLEGRTEKVKINSIIWYAVNKSAQKLIKRFHRIVYLFFVGVHSSLFASYWKCFIFGPKIECKWLVGTTTVAANWTVNWTIHSPLASSIISIIFDAQNMSNAVLCATATNEGWPNAMKVNCFRRTAHIDCLLTSSPSHFRFVQSADTIHQSISVRQKKNGFHLLSAIDAASRTQIKT